MADVVLPRNRARVESAVIGVVALGAGVLGLLEIAGVVAIPGKAVVSGALMAIGVLIVVTGRSERRRWPIVVGIGLVLGLAASSTPGVADIGQQTIVPATVGELGRSYQLGLGDTRVDLSRLAPSDLAGRQLAIHAGIGQARVILPEGLPARVTAHVGAGTLTVCGSKIGSGLGVRRTLCTGPPADPAVPNAPARFELDLRVSIGEAAVLCGGP